MYARIDGSCESAHMRSSLEHLFFKNAINTKIFICWLNIITLIDTDTGPKVIKLFFMLNSNEHEISTAHTNTIATNEEVLCVNSDVVFIMLTNVEMPTIVDILTFMNRINSCSAQL